MGELFVFTMIVVVFFLPLWLEAEYWKKLIKEAKEDYSVVDDHLFQITHEMIEAFNAGDMAREETLFQKAEGLRHYQYVVKKAKSTIKHDLPYSDIVQDLKEVNRKAAEKIQSMLGDENERYDLLEEQRRADYYLKHYMWQENLDPEGMYTVAEWNRFREVSTRARNADEECIKDSKGVDGYKMLHFKDYSLFIKGNMPLQTHKPAEPLSKRWKE